ncbi:MAG: hypothetical protein AB7N76_00520 [Planctomycetota bacterium]
MSRPQPPGARPTRAALAALLLPLTLLSGCAREGCLFVHPSEQLQERFPLSATTYSCTTLVTGVPLAVAALPVTVAVCAVVDQRHAVGLGPIKAPIALGSVAGLAVAAPVFAVELAVQPIACLVRRHRAPRVTHRAAPPPRPRPSAAPASPPSGSGAATPLVEPAALYLPLPPARFAGLLTHEPGAGAGAPRARATPARRSASGPATVVEWPLPSDLPAPAVCRTCGGPRERACACCARARARTSAEAQPASPPQGDE